VRARKTYAFYLATEEQDQLPPTRILTKSGKVESAKRSTIHALLRSGPRHDTSRGPKPVGARIKVPWWQPDLPQKRRAATTEAHGRENERQQLRTKIRHEGRKLTKTIEGVTLEREPAIGGELLCRRRLRVESSARRRA
jgi:hypothetical protein